jgi:uncharacterized protein YecA (UPF0149 family)
METNTKVNEQHETEEHEHEHVHGEHCQHHHHHAEGQTITNPNKLGRNDPCHCGSGKKFKKCCYQ